MMRRILRKTNSFLLAAAMAVTLMPAPMMPAAELDGTAVLQQEEKQAGDTVAQALDLEPITVIEGNAPVFPRKVSTESSGADAMVQWDQWDTGTAAGEYTATGTTVAGEQITVAVNVLPCDEVVADTAATGTENDDRNAIHPLKGYKGLFVTEYDIVPDSTKSTHDRAVIYLPGRIMKNGNWEELNSGNCWDTGARLQFKHGYNDVTYFQTQIGDGQVAGNAVYYPTNDELDAALANGDTSKAWVFDEVSTYRVRTVMDTASDTTKGNVKIYITDPDGIEHEVTQPGGNGFRIYPEDGIVSQFAAVRGSYTLKNHKVSWISGYATMQVETYLKAQDATEYTKEKNTIVTKELPGAVTAEEPNAEIIKDGQRYRLDTEKSGWYKGDEKSDPAAEAGETIAYRAYYNAVDKVQGLEPITVIEGNAPIFPKKISIESTGTTVDVQWDHWDAASEAGNYTVTGTADGVPVMISVDVLPCDEVVADAAATGRKEEDGGTAQDRVNSIHPLKGYTGMFVAEYDIVPDTFVTHDRAVIYLYETAADGTPLHSENCWDNAGSRIQFKYGYNDKRYFQSYDGNGNGDGSYWPMKDADLTAALDRGEAVELAEYDETKTYRVRTIMDTDTQGGNFKTFVTDPDGIQHEITKEGGNGFRIYSKDGIIKNFAAVRGSFIMKNHKISWISGYATKQVETYLKAPNAAEYTKYETVSAKELPGAMPAEQPEAEIIKNNQMYVLDTEMSGWYKGENKSEAVAEAGETVTYRAYYKAVDKADLNDKIQNASSLIEEDYTAGSWQTYQEALTKANQINKDATASQEAVDSAVGTLDTAVRNLVSIKNLKAAVAELKAELEEKEGQKADYANWDEVQSALKNAEEILEAANATKSQVETAERNLAITLIPNTKSEAEEAKKAMETSVTAAEQKMAGLKEADYTPASWSAIKAALEACKALNPETASKADYEAAKTALDRAVSGLAKLADKTALHQAIADAKAKKEADYEAAGYRSMQEKLAAANTVAANPNATQSEVDAAKTALQDAVSKLTARQSEVKVTSVQRAAKTYKIAAGKKLDLKKVFTALPEHADNRKLTYSIDKKYSKYASIKSGVVTVKRAGAGKTIAVKATAADGSGKTATVKIKIMKNAVTKITVKKASLTVKAGKKVTIKPVVRTNGKNVNKTLEYTSSNEKLATVKKGVVTAKKGKKGTVTITIKSTDGTNKSVKVKVTIRK